jgi:hypothetical protein
MNIAQLSEQLKDVPQGTLIGYAKNPNSVVPQFLALAEIQRRQQLQAPAQAPSGTVADDVLARANPVPQQMAPQQLAPQVDPRMLQAQAMQQQTQQLPENQPGVAQLPTGMPQGMASGGIVAFAGDNGSLVGEDDEDYQDYLEQRDTAKRRGMIDSAFESVRDRVAGIAGALPKSYDETKKSYQSTSSNAPEGIEGLLAKVGHLESGNKDYDKYGRLITSPKGAEGRMQTLVSTQRDPGYGVMPARDNSVEEKNRVGEDYFKAMMNEFKDPKIAAMAYNWGPGNVKKWIESGHSLPVPAETRKYASHFAKGGIAHFATGNKISLDDYNDTYNADDQRNVEPAPLTGIAALANTQATEDMEAGPAARTVGSYGPITTAETPLSAHDLFLQRLARERDEAIAEHANDKKLALLQAGLGMMAGTSPYAMANIGQGGMQGIAAYGAAQKQKAAELNAIRKTEGNVLDSQILGDIKRFGIEERASTAKGIAAERLAAAKSAAEDKLYAQQERNKLISTKEANDVREAALARFNADPMTKQLAKKLEDTTPGTPEFEWYTNEFNRLRNNALAQAKVEGAKAIPAASPFPTPKVEAPSSFWQMLPGTTKYSEDDLKALEWANANPLDPRANAIKERFK